MGTKLKDVSIGVVSQDPHLFHETIADNLRYAKAWGQGMFDGQRIQRDQELQDGFVVELHM